MSCVFCERFKTGKAHDFDGNYFWAVLDIHPVSPGHLLIIPKRHVLNTKELEPVEWRELWGMIETSKEWVKDAPLSALYEQLLDARITKWSPLFIRHAMSRPWYHKKPNGFNVCINEGAAAGQTVDHLHCHVIPRYEGDVPDPRGGVRYVIPKMGNYHEPSKELLVQLEALS